MSDIMNKISALLNQAENTDNPHERETFFQKAQSLAVRAEIDLEVARQRTVKKERRHKPEMRRVEVGVKGDRGAGAYAELYVNIAKVNGITCYYSNSEIDAYGMPEDLDYADTMYTFIVQQMVQDCMRYIDDGEWRSEPNHGGVHDAKRSFYHSYRENIRRRLQQAKDSAIREADQDYASDGLSSALVLADKEKIVREFYWENRKGARRLRPQITGSNRTAQRAGHSAASNARIAQTAAFSGSKGSIGQ